MPVARLESGTAHTHLCAEVGNPDVFCYVEEWPDVEDLDEHLRSPRFGRMLALMETAAEAPTIEFRFVSRIRGLDYVVEVREPAHDAAGK
jgi:quinol monooxygenase YgiN